MSLTRDQILHANDVKIETVDVPEWGGAVCVRSISGVERDAFEDWFTQGGKGRNYRNFRAKFASIVVCDEKGEPIFQPGDIDALGKKNAGALDRVLEAGQRLCGITAADVDELVKNSESGQSVDSGID